VSDTPNLSGQEQIRMAELEADAITIQAENENRFKLARTESRVKAGVAITSGMIVVSIIVAMVILTLQNKKVPDSIGPILPMLIGLMSGVALVNGKQGSK
jgi:hypothetical protein